jgi:DNA-binding transcriptional regulator YiaG
MTMNATERAQKKVDAVYALRTGVADGTLTVDAVSRKLHVDPETVRTWLRGDALPSGRRVEDLSRLMFK